VPDGKQRRDFTHVLDVVEANILAMQKDHDRYGEIFNVGTGKNYSVQELANMISSNTVMVAPRIGEAYITLADNNKIKEVFGWQPSMRLENYIKNELLRSV